MCIFIDVQRQKPNKAAAGLSNSPYLSCLMGLNVFLDARFQSKNPALHYFILNLLCDYVNQFFGALLASHYKLARWNHCSCGGD